MLSIRLKLLRWVFPLLPVCNLIAHFKLSRSWKAGWFFRGRLFHLVMIRFYFLFIFHKLAFMCLWQHFCTINLIFIYILYNWQINPIPFTHAYEVLHRASTGSTPVGHCKLLTLLLIQYMWTSYTITEDSYHSNMHIHFFKISEFLSLTKWMFTKHMKIMTMETI